MADPPLLSQQVPAAQDHGMLDASIFPCSIFDIDMVDCHLVCPTLLHCLSVFETFYLWIVGALNHLHPLLVLRLLFESVARLTPFESLISKAVFTSFPSLSSLLVSFFYYNFPTYQQSVIVYLLAYQCCLVKGSKVHIANIIIKERLIVDSSVSSGYLH